MNKLEYIFFYQRDLRKLRAEIEAYTNEDALWDVVPGTINPAGNLCQHLIGNLRTYVGLALGNFPYERNREAEFNARLFTKQELLKELDDLTEIVTVSLDGLSDQKLNSGYPHDTLTISDQQTVGLVLTHLAMHLAYHTGQINYHRRFICGVKNGNS